MAQSNTGLWIRDLRDRLALSQTVFADRLGVTNVTVSRWERGHVQPGPLSLRRLATLEAMANSTPKGKAATTGNLPVPSTAYFGRQREQLALGYRCQELQVVSIVGPAGVGKTRLAIEIGHRIASSFADGAALIDLAPVVASDAVPETAARALGIRSSGQTPLLEQIGSAVADRQMLVIVDNCEHLVPAARALITTLTTSRYLHVLATSRSRLNHPGELVESIWVTFRSIRQSSSFWIGRTTQWIRAAPQKIFAAGSMDCRSRSSWPPRGPPYCRHHKSRSVSTIDSHF